LQAWVTLGRAQLNYGEPDNAIQSFDRALALKVRSSIKLVVGFNFPQIFYHWHYFNTSMLMTWRATCPCVRFSDKIIEVIIHYLKSQLFDWLSKDKWSGISIWLLIQIKHAKLHHQPFISMMYLSIYSVWYLTHFTILWLCSLIMKKHKMIEKLLYVS
jgi:hypothetical protein